MYQHLEINEAVAGYSEAMESGDHFKNGASLKSQMSRRTFFLIISTAVTGCLVLTNCDNPQKSGEKIGREYCDCQKDNAKEQEKIYTDFLVKFDSYGFTTRPEARQKWQDIQDEAKRKIGYCTGKVDQKAKEVRSKFPTDASYLLDPKLIQQYTQNPKKYLKEFTNNQAKAKVFEDALRNAVNQCNVPEVRIDNSKIDEMILKIVPPKPNETNLKQNLVRRRITEQPGDYFGSGWAWQINSAEEIQSLKIEKEEKVGNDYAIDVHLVLQRDQSAQYEADLTLTCVLGQGDDWKIDFIKTKDIHIVKTGRYDSCITTEIIKGWGGTSFRFANTCDVALIIGGQILGNNNEWTKFSTRINANNTGSAYYNGKEYKIDFIERQ